MEEIWLDRGLEGIEYDENVIVDEFYCMNEKKEILSQKFKISHIDIEKCYIYGTLIVYHIYSEDEQKNNIFMRNA